MNYLRTADLGLARRLARQPTNHLVLIFLVLSFAGCSFVFSKGPPSDYREQGYFDCSGYTAPAFDTVWAGLNGLGALMAASSNDTSWKQQGQTSDRSSTVAVGLVWLALSGASAIYGYHNASACADAKEEMAGETSTYRPRRRVRYVPPKPPTLPPPAPAKLPVLDPEATPPGSPQSPPSGEEDPFQAQ